MPARAIKLSQGALYGVASLTVQEVRERVRSRYPEAAPLPDPPVLDTLLQEAGFEFQWNPTLKGVGGYVSRLRDSLSVSSRSESAVRQSTGMAPEGGWRSPPRSPTPASSRNGSGMASRKGPSTRCS